jgi:hypothetical protein
LAWTKASSSTTLQGAEAQLLEPGLLPLQEIRAHVRERRAPPQRQRLTEPGRDLVRLARGALDEPSEHRGVDLVGSRPQCVSLGNRLEGLCGPGRRELLAQTRNMDLEGVDGGGREALAPQGVDQPGHRHGLPGTEHQGGEQRPLPLTRERDHLAVGADHLH